MTKHAEFDGGRQGRTLDRLWRQSGRGQTIAAAGDMSHSQFWRLLKGHQPLREDQYPQMARALGVSIEDLYRAMAGDAKDEQAPDSWDFRAELEAALPGDPNGFARAWQRWADEPYEYQRAAIEAYRVLRDTSDETHPEFPYRPDDGPNGDVQRNMQRHAR